MKLLTEDRFHDTRLPRKVVSSVRSTVILGVLWGIFIVPVLCAETTSPVANHKVQESTEANRMASIEAKIDRLTERIDRVADDSARLKTEALKETTDRAFQALQWGGLFLGALIAVHTVLTWFFAWQRERQQLQIGDKFVEKTDRLLEGQLKNIGGLGSVLSLLESTFSREEKIIDQITKIREEFVVWQEGRRIEKQQDRQKYEHAKAQILSFETYSRVRWTELTDAEFAQANIALNTFDFLPLELFDEKKASEQSKLELAKVYQLLGVAAFYSQQIDRARQYFESSIELYGTAPPPAEHTHPKAFASHYLAILKKNWWDNRRYPSPDDNLREARNLIESARNQLSKDGREFLTPVTHVEILSYLGDTAEATAELDKILTQFEDLKMSSPLNDNQKKLHVRALLIRGNLELIINNDNRQQARKWYLQAHVEADSQSPYALLSVAHTTDFGQSDEMKEHFAKGLELLHKSKLLEKREMSSRLTALAWAAIASYSDIGDGRMNDHQSRLKTECEKVKNLEKYVPLFFCPSTKKLVGADMLFGNTMTEIDRLSGRLSSNRFG